MKNTGENYNVFGLIIVTFLMLAGVGIIYYTWGDAMLNPNNILRYVGKHPIELLASLFFIGMGSYCWYKYIQNIIIKPKNDVMYLLSIKDDMYIFVDRDGNKIMKTINSRLQSDDICADLSVDNFYNVLKTKDVIKKIEGKSEVQFGLVKKNISYWNNFYSSKGNFENIMLLPVIYVCFFFGLITIFVGSGSGRITGLFFAGTALYMIINDYRIKEKKKTESEGQGENNEKN